MNQFGGYEGTEGNDELLATLVPRIGVQARAVVDEVRQRRGSTEGVTIVVVFRPEPDCRAADVSDVIAMMDRRGESRIAEILRTEALGPNEHWLAIQRFEEGGGVIVMAKIRLGEVDSASLIN